MDARFKKLGELQACIKGKNRKLHDLRSNPWN